LPVQSVWGAPCPHLPPPPPFYQRLLPLPAPAAGLCRLLVTCLTFDLPPASQSNGMGEPTKVVHFRSLPTNTTEAELRAHLSTHVQPTTVIMLSDGQQVWAVNASDSEMGSLRMNGAGMWSLV
jgi:hypothetical protein